MASGRPPGDKHDDLLDLDSSRPLYNSGQAPPVNDDRLTQRFNIDDSETPRPRPSVSYDNFVGGDRAPATSTSHGGDAQPHFASHQNYSQTSGLNNYERYADDDLEDDHSVQRYYDDQNASFDNVPGGVNVVGGQARNRNSILSMGGGFTGKVKNMLGMAPGYSEMDLPLTEAGGRGSRVEGVEHGEPRRTSNNTAQQPPCQFRPWVA